jgi:membrane protease YdiL (CAAX protease family)
VRLAALAEGGLVLLALAVGKWLGAAPFAAFEWSWRGLAWGIAATAPLLLALRWCLRTRFGPVVRLVRLVEERVAPVFAGSSGVELALVSLLAGVGEEALFRGVLQTALLQHLPLWGAVGLTAVAFGLVHWLTPTYAALATLVGAYLGWIYAASGNLLVPIVAHALYDLVALGVIVKRGEG